jgi:hypothetical protein
MARLLMSAGVSVVISEPRHIRYCAIFLGDNSLVLDRTAL